MPPRERFLVLLASYVAVLRPEGIALWTIERSLDVARSVNFVPEGRIEEMAWEGARWVCVMGAKKPSWWPE